jgi:hypothetical protein
MEKLFDPLSGIEIHDFLPNATILKYSQLKHLKKLPHLPLVILYEVKPDFGHWVTILETPDGIEHFDSYGYVPDDELSFIPDNFKVISDQNNKYLLSLLYNSNEPIHYNQYTFQGGNDIATCGRWVILRNMFDDLTIDQFANMIYKTSQQTQLSPDQIVSIAI